ncbi:hypothetical protein ACFWN5_44820 [Streptomyces sp. NPDC058430]|uniref:hypothetical protein n=1 Tax=Streptomyces sp. NPDC058430 TaxID=3346495 RepID=UPI003657887F
MAPTGQLVSPALSPWPSVQSPQNSQKTHGDGVRAGPMVVEAEVVTVYPGNLRAVGAHIMSRAAALVAARR